jgi:hypothetical protein
MRFYGLSAADLNFTEEAGINTAWRTWIKGIGNPNFNEKVDMWIATRPLWRMVGCAWSGYCDSPINGRVLSCMFWDANNNSTLGRPQI